MIRKGDRMRPCVTRGDVSDVTYEPSGNRRHRELPTPRPTTIRPIPPAAWSRPSSAATTGVWLCSASLPVSIRPAWARLPAPTSATSGQWAGVLAPGSQRSASAVVRMCRRSRIRRQDRSSPGTYHSGPALHTKPGSSARHRGATRDGQPITACPGDHHTGHTTAAGDHRGWHMGRRRGHRRRQLQGDCTCIEQLLLEDRKVWHQRGRHR